MRAKVPGDTDKRYQSFYFPTELLKQIYVEARRLDLSLSKVVHLAWEIAYEEVKKRPTVNEDFALPPPEVKETPVAVVCRSQAQQRLMKKLGL